MHLVCNKIVSQSDVVGASPVSAAPTTSSFLILGIGAPYIRYLMVYIQSFMCDTELYGNKTAISDFIAIRYC